MKDKEMYKWAEETAEKSGFKIRKLIYSASFQSKDNLRNVIYSGIYKGKPAVIKVYEEPKISLEPISQKAYNKYNKERGLTAPEVYLSKVISPNKGWLIMEKLPEDGHFFSSPLDKKGRKEFLKVSLKYKKSFSKKPTRPLMLAEKLPPHEFHLYRISRWFELANTKETDLELKNKKTFLDTKRYFPLYFKSLEDIRKEFSKRKMEWAHGHFKPKDIYYSPKKKTYYITDFAHNHMFPEGYELGFIIWADWIMTNTWQKSYSKFRAGVYEWIDELQPIAKELGIKRYRELIRVCMIERLNGYILADVCSTNRPREEKEKRLDHALRLLKEFLIKK